MRDYEVISNSEVRYGFTELDDFTDNLMTKYHRFFQWLEPDFMDIREADAAGIYPQQDVAFSNRWSWKFLNA